MDGNRVTKLVKSIGELKDRVGTQTAAKLQFDKCERIVEKLKTFESTCKICETFLLDLEEQISHLVSMDIYEKETVKEFTKLLGIITSHLQKEHHIVSSGYYLGIYMTMGTSIGMLFGLTIFDNIGVGMALGTAFGVMIGISLDADAKKKGLTL